MNEYIIHNIITEEINKIIVENGLDEKKNHHTDYDKLFKKYFRKIEKLNKKDKKKKKHNNKKLLKTKNGGKEIYDYDEYEKNNVKVSAGDASAIRNAVDVEKTNMASVARDFLPGHTDAGAQSQFRKIMNGERPMTKKMASKIEKYISQGKIAVK